MDLSDRRDAARLADAGVNTTPRGQASVTPAAITGVTRGASSNELAARAAARRTYREVEVVHGRGWTLVDGDLSGMKLS